MVTMHIHHTIQVALLFAGAATLTVGCSTHSPGPRAYQPLPRQEAAIAAQARRDVLPDDVRRNPQACAETLVAWTGVITNIEYFTNISPRLVRFTADHRYFDWQEDSGKESGRFQLSSRGEGAFAVQWVAQTPYDLKFVYQFAIGDMLIAYGYPTIIRSNYIGLNPSENLRAIKPKWYTSEGLDYGRSGKSAGSIGEPAGGMKAEE
jgi:hypothetical protein